MTNNDDATFFRYFAVVLGALVAFTLFCIVLANRLSPPADRDNDPLVQQMMQKQYGAVGQSRIDPESEARLQAKADAAADAAAQPAVEQTQSVAAPAVIEQPTIPAGITSKVVAEVETNCAGCHQNGVLGAQRLDDSAAWSALAARGIDELTASVITGKGKMPARAESILNDDELRQAVVLMLHKTGNPVSDETDAAPAAEASPAIAKAAPAEVSAEVKTVVDTTCAACHSAGVANAPRFGDAAAWEPRLENGMDALIASAITGKGAMPARGASNLDDAQMAAAVAYMLSK